MKYEEETKQFKDFVDSLNKKSLSTLLAELKDEPSSLEAYKSLSEEQWLRRSSTCGDIIYNHLHPQGSED
jgi:hypothetical protein